MSFSNDAGGALALPSPTHPHHQMDVTSTVRSLRRTLSRSPSKLLSRTKSEGLETSSQASPQSPCRRYGTPLNQQQSHLPLSHAHTAPSVAGTADVFGLRHSPSFSPLRSSRLSLRSVKSSRTLSPRPLTRSRVSPKSPIRRVLDTSQDTGNQIKTSTPSPAQLKIAQECGSFTPRSPLPRRRSAEKTPQSSRHSLHLDVSGSAGSPQHGLFTNLGSRPLTSMQSTSGALKRSDATMNLDRPARGGPVAKRRSMHGISGLMSTDDMNIFSPGKQTRSQAFDIHEDAHPEYQLTGGPAASEQPVSFPGAPTDVSQRTTSLRKSTLQQRYGDNSLGKRTGERQLAEIGPHTTTPSAQRPRLLNEHFHPLGVARDSPFGFPTSQSTLNLLDTRSQQPHPLSKTLTTSSSGESIDELLTEDQAAPKPATKNPFSKSLPVNATRPLNHPLHDHSRIAATPSHPNKLWAGAFNSTGLISKVNRNPEDDSDKKLAPPDTPCKRPSNPFATYPPPSGGLLKRSTNNRNSFSGISATPFKPFAEQAPDTFGKPARGLSIFQRGSALRSSRRGSLLRLDDDQKLFGEQDDSSQMTDSDVPPTPTRQTLPLSLSNLSEQSQESPSANRSIQAPMSALRPPISRQQTSSPLGDMGTPQTPQEAVLPLDTSRMSISQGVEGDSEATAHMPPPVTPTTGRDFRSSTSVFVTPVNARSSMLDVDGSMYAKFDKVEEIGKGEFSFVYRATKTELHDEGGLVSTTPGQDLRATHAATQCYAVKKSKHPYQGPKDREHKLREVEILKALVDAEHVVHYVDHWEHNFHLYIQTEFCEEGTLDKFLGYVGTHGRLDDFRIFKIIQDLCLGLKDIHDAGFMHLDMKPANILITFEGVLKIADFGLAQSATIAGGVDVEGDREYMAPEMLEGRVGKPCDIFSVGLIVLETAGNVVLPDNGPTWVALRSGDLSEVPSLTSNVSSAAPSDSFGTSVLSNHVRGHRHGSSHDASNLFGSLKRSELQDPPEFMVNSFHPSSLDGMVRWMTAQDPEHRPTVDQILDLDGMRWIAERRAAATTVYEGSWGPAEPFPVTIAVDPEDTEMVDA